MPEPLPITVCTLCLNEAGNLPRCLQLREAFDEWIVLDTGSSDNSIAVAEALGARVERSLWLNFSATRRYHFSLARNRWILWIDADEEITPSFVEEIRNLLPRIDEHSAYTLNRQMFFQGNWIRHGDWFPDRVTRLFRDGDWTMPERTIHESLTIEGSIGSLKELIPHFSYKSWADRRKRIKAYSKLWAVNELKRGRNVSLATPLLRATWKFFRGFIFRGGILDGWLGFQIAFSNAGEVHRKYRCLRNAKTIAEFREVETSSSQKS